jgi:hypothetical protein
MMTFKIESWKRKRNERNFIFLEREYTSTSNNKSVTKERHRWTKAERQYIQGIVHNYSLQRWTDQDIVNFLWEEKKIKIARSTVTTIKNQVEQRAKKWYIELRESGSKYVAVYKERLDSLLSYQKKLHDIISVSEKPEVQVRAISELHSIEMSLHSLYQDFPRLDIKPDSDSTTTEEGCNCGPRNGDIINHSKCRYCHQVWCPTTLNQDWCPNPECDHGIKGCNYQPWDEHNKWIKCPSCQIWFKNNDILAVHNCYMKANPKAIEGDIPGIGGEGEGPIIEEPLVHQDQVMLKSTEQLPPSNEPEPRPETITSLSSPIEEQTEIEEEEEPEESEADRYWRNHPHPSIKSNNNNNKVKFVVE